GPEPKRWLIADGASGRVRILDLDPAVKTLRTAVGYPDPSSPDSGDARYSRLLSNPAGIAFDAQNSAVYVSESEGHTIRRIDLRTWRITTLAGALGDAGHVNGVLGTSRFSSP